MKVNYFKIQIHKGVTGNFGISSESSLLMSITDLRRNVTRKAGR